MPWRWSRKIGLSDFVQIELKFYKTLEISSPIENPTSRSPVTNTTSLLARSKRSKVFAKRAQMPFLPFFRNFGLFWRQKENDLQFFVAWNFWEIFFKIEKKTKIGAKARNCGSDSLRTLHEIENNAPAGGAKVRSTRGGITALATYWLNYRRRYFRAWRTRMISKNWRFGLSEHGTKSSSAFMASSTVWWRR